VADISDVTAYLAAAATAVIYPNGIGSPSITGHDVRIFEGWPLADQLDRDMTGTQLVAGKAVPRPGGPVANVSVYPLPGATAVPYQILDHTYTIVNPQQGLTVTVNGNVVTISGTPNSGEYVTAVVDRSTVLSATAATVAALLAALQSQAVAAGYAATTDGIATLTVPFKYEMDVRQGAVGTLARVTHRQKQGIMVTVWAPDPPTRTTLSAAVDAGLKTKNIVTLPDTSEALMTYSRTTLVDTYENVTVYRRDLIFDAEYATLEQFPGYVITSVAIQLAGGWRDGPQAPPSPPPAITIDP